MIPSRFIPLSLSLVGLLAFASCDAPLSIIAPGTASWRVEWNQVIEVRCIASTELEVASRHEVTGSGTFRIERPITDTRTEIDDIASSATMPKISFSLSSNCNPSTHDNAVVVAQPRAETPWELDARVIEHPGIDSVQITLRGRITPAVASIRLKDAERTVIEAPVMDGDAGFSVTLPYSFRANKVQFLLRTPDDAVRSLVSVTMKYAGE
ncbi:MAG TPA: hypothetical protein VNA88_10825 [Candidatus Kapabacteria bacterium]|jgi:hypothetical protein|nr:hypothetical protein [Candidatus Kapabacteria bacterium]